LNRASDGFGLGLSASDSGLEEDAGNRRARYFTAAGSANEARVALKVAIAWGHITADRSAFPLALLDRIVAMLWKLSR
jgi:hypothetical protein